MRLTKKDLKVSSPAELLRQILVYDHAFVFYSIILYNAFQDIIQQKIVGHLNHVCQIIQRVQSTVQLQHTVQPLAGEKQGEQLLPDSRRFFVSDPGTVPL